MGRHPLGPYFFRRAAQARAHAALVRFFFGYFFTAALLVDQQSLQIRPYGSAQFLSAFAAFPMLHKA
jgi:hypothetical protein